ncbi:hypothetical protein [Candidiatus Paracoxiella cheracis]|uniref:hypothetical protein n=1 Tax=Candidiatus Paracoxiella cheracis TaxID=3405120 RepID=UPI003BF4641D
MKKFATLISTLIALASVSLPSAFALAQADLGTTIVAFPSNSAMMTPTLDEDIKNNRNKYPGSNSAYLAYQQRDLAWAKAQEVLNTIGNGEFTNQYIMANTATKYSESFIINSQEWIAARRIIASFGPNAAKLSLMNQGQYSDYLKIMAPHNESQVYVAVVHYFPGCNDQKCVYSIVGLVANSPYKNWQLAGFHIFSRVRK